MRTIFILPIAAVFVLGLSGSGHAAPNSRARTGAFAKLPNWNGIWVQDTIEWGVNGRFDRPPIFKLAAHPPYNAEWEAQYQARLKAEPPPGSKSCRINFPTMMESPQPFEITAVPEETILTFGDGGVRYIMTDGRAHPKPEDFFPTPTGDAIGHWEGETLVADTIGSPAGQIGLISAVVISGKAHFTERLHMADANTLQDQMTIDDPVAFTKPWQITLEYKRVTYLDRIIPYDCDNDRVQVVGGKDVIVTP